MDNLKSENLKKLAAAFPASLRDDALRAIACLPETGLKAAPDFPVHVNGHEVRIPSRIYNASVEVGKTQLNALQQELLSCLLTRHHDGFVRQANLERIIKSKNEWVPPFVVTLSGEYIVEILQTIYKNSNTLEKPLYKSFLDENTEYFERIRQRVASYWDCYYRSTPKKDYVGFQLLDFFDTLR